MKKEKLQAAYQNIDFLKSREARTIRIISEYLEPEKRLEELNIFHTVVFFGSARIKSNKKSGYTNKYYWAAEEFAYRLAGWSGELEKHGGKGFYITTGGGPGIMEAANRGANRAGAKTIGLNISIPFEQQPNKYITPELNFEFHYFFMRKLWFLYHAKALIVFPGGFGTLDELFETLTMLQTRKIEKGNIPILLYDKEYWQDLINFKKLIEYNLISPKDLNLFYYFNDLDDGLNYLKPRLEKFINKVNHGLVKV
ncbi:MAG: LOG family protein [Spirochaetes bacterium]|nr:LOG family protein [Spirochaetota bacterium]